MIDDPGKTFQDLVKHVGRYPAEAFFFVREGLGYAAEEVHGPETEAHRVLHRFLTALRKERDRLDRSGCAPA